MKSWAYVGDEGRKREDGEMDPEKFKMHSALSLKLMPVLIIQMNREPLR